MTEAIRITAIAGGGDGVGILADGRAVFVPRSAPGDCVELAKVVRFRRFARARIARIVEPSPDRITPACPHYEADDCGGCQLQHLHPDAQRAARRAIVGDALRRIGHLQVEDPVLEPSEVEWGYRAKITLTVGRPSQEGPEGGPAVERSARVAIGYHPLEKPNQVFDLTRCPIARPELNALWAGIRQHRELLPRNAERLGLWVDRTGGCHAIVRAKGSEAWTGARKLGQALLGQPGFPVLWWQPEGGAPRTVYGTREAYPAIVFEQVHPVMGDRVRAYAVAQLGDLAGRHVWDLYAGIGETTARLVGSVKPPTVESVELDPRAVRIAEQRGSPPSSGVTRIVGRVEEVLDRLHPADAVIVNPPRTGLGNPVTSRLAVQPASRLVYVSCDPATLARDLARLDRVYRLVSLRAFDLFPQTAHVETVALLERR